MGSRVRGVGIIVVVLVTGAFLGSAISQWWTAPRVTAEGAARAVPIFGAERTRVEVLNGGGKSGMARSATEALRDRGFDVVFFGNDDVSDRDSSFVLARTDRLDLARSVADALGIREVKSEPDANLFLDVSVVLGAAWAPDSIPDMATEGSAEEQGLPWWDPRGWVRRPGAPESDARLVDPGETGQ